MPSPAPPPTPSPNTTNTSSSLTFDHDDEITLSLLISPPTPTQTTNLSTRLSTLPSRLPPSWILTSHTTPIDTIASTLPDRWLPPPPSTQSPPSPPSSLPPLLSTPAASRHLHTLSTLLHLPSHRAANLTLSSILHLPPEQNESSIPQLLGETLFLLHVRDYYYRQTLSQIRIIAECLRIVMMDDEGEDGHLYAAYCKEFLDKLEEMRVLRCGTKRGLFYLLSYLAFLEDGIPMAELVNDEVLFHPKKRQRGLSVETMMTSLEKSHASFTKKMRQESLEACLLWTYDAMLKLEDVALILKIYAVSGDNMSSSWQTTAGLICCASFGLYSASSDDDSSKNSLASDIRNNNATGMELLLSLLPSTPTTPSALLSQLCGGISLSIFSVDKFYLERGKSLLGAANAAGAIDALHAILSHSHDELSGSIGREILTSLLSSLELLNEGGIVASRTEDRRLLSHLVPIVYRSREVLCLPFWIAWEKYMTEGRRTAASGGGDENLCRLVDYCRTVDCDTLDGMASFLELMSGLCYDGTTLKYCLGCDLISMEGCVRRGLGLCASGEGEVVRVFLEALGSLLQWVDGEGRAMIGAGLGQDGLKCLHAIKASHPELIDCVIGLYSRLLASDDGSDLLLSNDVIVEYPLIIAHAINERDASSPIFPRLLNNMIQYLPVILQHPSKYSSHQFLQILTDAVGTCLTLHLGSNIVATTTTLDTLRLGHSIVTILPSHHALVQRTLSSQALFAIVLQHAASPIASSLVTKRQEDRWLSSLSSSVEDGDLFSQLFSSSASKNGGSAAGLESLTLPPSSLLSRISSMGLKLATIWLNKCDEIEESLLNTPVVLPRAAAAVMNATAGDDDNDVTMIPDDEEDGRAASSAVEYWSRASVSELLLRYLCNANDDVDSSSDDSFESALSYPTPREVMQYLTLCHEKCPSFSISWDNKHVDCSDPLLAILREGSNEDIIALVELLTISLDRSSSMMVMLINKNEEAVMVELVEIMTRRLFEGEERSVACRIAALMGKVWEMKGCDDLLKSFVDIWRLSDGLWEGVENVLDDVISNNECLDNETNGGCLMEGLLRVMTVELYEKTINVKWDNYKKWGDYITRKLLKDDSRQQALTSWNNAYNHAQPHGLLSNPNDISNDDDHPTTLSFLKQWGSVSISQRDVIAELIRATEDVATSQRYNKMMGGVISSWRRFLEVLSVHFDNNNSQEFRCETTKQILDLLQVITMVMRLESRSSLQMACDLASALVVIIPAELRDDEDDKKETVMVGMTSLLAKVIAFTRPSKDMVNDSIRMKNISELQLMLRLRLMTVGIQLTRRNDEDSSLSPIERKKRFRERIGFVDAVGDTLTLLTYAPSKKENNRNDNKTNNETLIQPYTYNFSPSNQGLSLLRSTLYLLLRLLPSTSKHSPSPGYASDLAASLQRHDTIPTILRHLSHAFLYAAETYDPTSPPDETVDNAVDVAEIVVSFVNLTASASVADGDDDNLFKLLFRGMGDLLTKHLIENPLLKLATGMWTQWTTNGTNARGYARAASTSTSDWMRESLLTSSTTTAAERHRDDPVHLLWRSVLTTMTSLSYHSSDMALDFVYAYNATMASSLVGIETTKTRNEQEPSNVISLFGTSSSTPMTSTSRSFFRTKNSLHEACLTLHLLSTLPSIPPSLTSPLLRYLSRTSIFLGTASSARQLFAMINHSQTPTSPLTTTTTPSSMTCSPHARHEAIAYAHHTGRWGRCVTSDDCHQRDQSYDGTSDDEQPTTSPKSRSDSGSFRHHVTNKFVSEMEQLAARGVQWAITILQRRGMVMSAQKFITLDRHNVNKIDWDRVLRPGMVVQIREEGDGVMGCRYARIVRKKGGGRYEVVYVNDPMEAVTEVETYRFVGVRDDEDGEVGVDYEIELEPAPMTASAIVGKGSSSSDGINGYDSVLSVGHLIFILKWCKERATMTTTGGEIMKTSMLGCLAERTGLFLVTSLAEIKRRQRYDTMNDEFVVTEREREIDNAARRMKDEAINMQLLDLFDSTAAEDGGSSIDVVTTGSGGGGGDLKNVMDEKIWDVILMKLKGRLDTARDSQRLVEDRRIIHHSSVGWRGSAGHGSTGARKGVGRSSFRGSTTNSLGFI